MNRVRNNLGFTLIELILVITILGVLAAVAAPRFVDLSSDARRATITQLEANLKAVNAQLTLKDKIPGSRILDASGDLDSYTLDLNGNNVIDDADVLMAFGFLNNTEITKVLTLDERIFIRESRTSAWIGYDDNGDGNPQNDRCYIFYRQPIVAGQEPFYNPITDQC